MFSMRVKSDLEKSGKTFEKQLTKQVEGANKKAAAVVQTEARRTHRYTRRTGTLERAVQSQALKDVAKIYISDALAPYGEYIHNGTRKWSADPFLTTALRKHGAKIKKLLDDAINTAIKRAGLK